MKLNVAVSRSKGHWEQIRESIIIHEEEITRLFDRHLSISRFSKFIEYKLKLFNIDMSSDACDLCKYSKSILTKRIRCKKCPLPKKDKEIRCDDYGSFYSNVMDATSYERLIEATDKMVEVLNEIQLELFVDKH